MPYHTRKLFNKGEYSKLRKILRSDATKGEKILWRFIKNSQLGFKFRRQHGVGNYIVDFYCPEIRLAVEVDGLTHADEKVFDNDQIRQKFIEKEGIIVRRYSSEQIFNDMEQVLEDLYNFSVSLRG